MSKFDQLVRVQTDRIESLKRLFSNVKKDSSARKTEIYFEKRLNQIDEFNKEFHQAHHTLICMADYEESVYKQQNTISQFEDLGMEVYCFVAEEKKRIYPVTVTHNESTNSTITTHVEEVRIPLPKLPVPKFSGNCADWPSFHDAFLRLIHNNERLDKIQRFHFLKEALPVGLDNDIRQIALTEANYEVAWTTLLQRYNNPRIVFASHMNMLYNLPSLSKEKSADIRSMVSTVNVCIAACNTVKAPLQGGDFWLTHYLTTKLPKDTHTAWEHHLGSKIDVPSYKDLQQFLNDRLVTLDAIESRNACSGMKQSNETSEGTKRVRVHSAHTRSGASASACYHCGSLHILRRCPQFLSMDCYQRKEVASKAKLCLNCLGKSHTQASCPSNKNCLHCGQRHHTMLHFPVTQPTLIPSSTSCQSSAASSDAKPTLQCMSTTTSSMTHRKVLLATARVVLSNTQTGCQATVNALLDQGSEATIISEHAVQSLQLSRSTTRTSITGVGQDSGRRCKFIVSCSVQTATNPNFSLKVDDAYVLNTLTSHMPSQSFPAGNWSHIHGLMLADPYYYRSKRIDIIFGADLMAQLLLPGTKIGLPNEPIAQNTQLGWVLLGNVGNTHITRHIRCNHAIINSEELLKVFCEVESVPERPKLSKEDQWCESFFKQTHQRQPDGSYQVRLPFKRNFDPSMTLGKSHQIALNRYLQLERRLQRDPDKWRRYCKGIEEYFQLGQITLAETSENSTITTDSYGQHVASCVLPHHAVFKEESLTTKQRIVFDASARTSNGRSLNDVLCVGPTLQNDLPAVLLNWRQYQFVFTADIQRMYRCINVHPDDTQYQRILWRAADGVIKQHCLTTVTFGTASAPYTAIRVIHQIAEDTQTKHPMASNVLKNEMYVDDILSGDHSQEAAIRKSLQTMLALKSSGMELRKWASNDQELMATIPLEHRCKQTSLSWDNADTIKTLDLVIQHSHQLTLHGGAQLTLSHIRYKFWIPRGRQAVRRIIRKCVPCFKVAPVVAKQLMGDLPVHRVNPPTRPFITTGVDYTGAIELQAARVRGSTTYKGYVAIFICLATKAVHLEAVTGLSTEHFLQAFTRFTGRRGQVQHMYSDNGTNFVGASTSLNQPITCKAALNESTCQHGTRWHFTPPYSPNFGGIWEANVKAMKHHLKRIVGSHKQTYEELTTVLIRIEACLNSRPLCPLTADPDDLEVLTPAHFLIGDALLAPPQGRPNNKPLRELFLAQQHMMRQFWSQWSRDWLSHLQTRPKWCQIKENLNINDLVIIKDDNLPPAKWTIGRVVELHPGTDSLVRVVTLKTKSGIQKRSITKLCPLPIST
ncbi:uncharacterized protein LOC117139899 [Drosophila mauritiana]|uniref:Uncharacterized protein LOC117139899 n=1 Tax=Drosophila mauritiana TaxID=7226 RepID=A0A6P8JQR2_DROMA|nr:uncharacterized protein LOC117139899 [Drosophila mauritiana]